MTASAAPDLEALLALGARLEAIGLLGPYRLLEKGAWPWMVSLAVDRVTDRTSRSPLRPKDPKEP